MHTLQYDQLTIRHLCPLSNREPRPTNVKMTLAARVVEWSEWQQGILHAAELHTNS